MKRKISASPSIRVSDLRAIVTWLQALAVACALTVAAPAPALAQVATPVLVLNQERLLRDSRKGQQILDEEQRIRSERAQRGAELERQLEDEEQRLADQRADMDPKEFEKLAEDFDRKVVAIRQEDVRTAEQLASDFEAKRKEFFAAVVPIVAQIMNERGASLVFEQRNVLFTGPNIDITDDVIARMDKDAGLN